MMKSPTPWERVLAQYIWENNGGNMGRHQPGGMGWKNFWFGRRGGGDSHVSSITDHKLSKQNQIREAVPEEKVPNCWKNHYVEFGGNFKFNYPPPSRPKLLSKTTISAISDTIFTNKRNNNKSTNFNNNNHNKQNHTTTIKQLSYFLGRDSLKLT